MIGTRVLTLDGGSFEVREETPRLWVAHEMGSYGVRTKWRFPKTGGNVRTARNERGHKQDLFLTEEALALAKHALAEVQWARKHGFRLAHFIQYGGVKPSILRQVAALVGYKAEE